MADDKVGRFLVFRGEEGDADKGAMLITVLLASPRRECDAAGSIEG